MSKKLFIKKVKLESADDHPKTLDETELEDVLNNNDG